jgi:hypothetical protein
VAVLPEGHKKFGEQLPSKSLVNAMKFLSSRENDAINSEICNSFFRFFSTYMTKLHLQDFALSPLVSIPFLRRMC